MNGVYFDGKHSYEDFGLILSSKTISPPKPKTNNVEVPGRNGSLDLTEVLTGAVQYEDRTISITFTVIDPMHTWSNKISALENFLHGKRMKIIFDDDSTHYYIGRVFVNSWTSSKTIGSLEVECTVDPYKYDVRAEWLWNPFDFEEDVINEIPNIHVSGTASETITVRRKNTYPTIICSAAMSVEYKDVEYELAAGTNKPYEMLLDEGECTLTFTGNGTVTIDYIGGSL